MVFREQSPNFSDQSIENKRKITFEAFFTRHGAALYREHKRILESDNPEAQMDPVNALKPDLDPNHTESVREAAGNLLDSLDSKKDEIFIVSSNLPRAIETANIYRELAHERGFSITHHGERARDEYANSLGSDEIRILNNLNLNVENLVTLSVFHPSLKDQSINWENVSDETKMKWKKARAIIEADNGANWGENFVAHADEISKLYPDVGRAKVAYEKQFKNLLRLVKFAANRGRDIKKDKNIKVLAFGHENYIRPFLQERFGDPEIDNVETIKFEVGENMLAERRKKRRVIE